MCGRFTLTVAADAVADAFGVEKPGQLAPRYNIAPSQPVAIVRMNADTARRELTLAQWGLVPFWAKDPSIGNRMINARAETVAEKPAYRAAFKRRRCLIPADGFYEWHKAGGSKTPYLVRMGSGEVFGFAGLWESWTGPDGAELESCTIVTTEPNSLVKGIHNRMPAIVAPEAYDLWLDIRHHDAEGLSGLLRPCSSDAMNATPVSDWVNNPRHDDERCVEPAA